MTQPKPIIICDFDGTVACEDVGYQLFCKFSGGKNKALLPDWEAGLISNREILSREAEMVQAAPEEIYAFLERFELDSSFSVFVERCNLEGIQPIIISEGMDFYIEFLLVKYSLDHLQVISNKGIIENNGITILFPHINRKCERCGSCKGERISELRSSFPEDLQVVFIGDGYSDACAAQEADMVFAKKELVTYCENKRIPFIAYETFKDVSDELEARQILRR